MSGIVVGGLHHERERKADVGTDGQPIEERIKDMDLVRAFVLSDPHYVPRQDTTFRPGFAKDFPFDPPRHTKEVSHRIYYHTLQPGFAVEWRIKSSNKHPGQYVQCVKIGADTKDRLEFEHDIEGPAPDMGVFSSAEKQAVKKAVGGGKLKNLALYPVIYSCTQSWTYLYSPKGQKAVVEHKHDRGLEITILDKVLEKEALPILQVEQELKEGQCDLDKEMEYLTDGFNKKTGRQVLLRTEASKPSRAFNRMASHFGEEKIRQALYELLPRAVTPAEFERKCMISPEQLMLRPAIAA